MLCPRSYAVVAVLSAFVRAPAVPAVAILTSLQRQHCIIGIAGEARSRVQPRVPPEREWRIHVLTEPAGRHVLALEHELQLDVEMIAGEESDQVTQLASR